MLALKDLLKKYRENAKTEREKGTYFENLVRVFLQNDRLQSKMYGNVWTYADWAENQGLEKTDTGIDLVAELADDDGFCAIQCKFYDEDHTIQKADIDSFFTASGKEAFQRRLIVDTTRGKWGKNAEAALDGQSIETLRIDLNQLENSNIDWSVYAATEKVKHLAPKSLMDHQREALQAVEAGFKDADRGKLVMACGTGKTFTSLKIAETYAGVGKRVLYLVPSLALMSQTVREWTNDSEIPLNSYAVCSDVQVGKRKVSDDLADLTVHDLAYPATTDPGRVAEKLVSISETDMTVVFSTYQSIQVISEAQNEHGLAGFDLIICDEAHRTTGATASGDADSNFVKVHNQDYIQGKKRLYMTATPRIFSEPVKAKADEYSVELFGMNDESYYGKTFHEVTFSYAVEKGLLTDYKVIVLAVDEEVVSSSVQKRLSDEDSELVLDDVTKIIGCYKALTKAGLKSELTADHKPMHRALAFCQSIAKSKIIRDEFEAVVTEYLREEGEETSLTCELDHVDGTYKAKERSERLDWLSEEAGEETCRILSNARCLSEGVDVPALDAIMFLHPRKSQVDVVQSVGRVMRRAPGKSMGYVILPVGIPAGMSAEQALSDNKKYQVVWQILNALRSHDDRFNATINKATFDEDVSDKIEIVSATTAIVDNLPQKQEKPLEQASIGSGGGAEKERDVSDPSTKPPSQIGFVFDEFQKAILAKIVKKCGTRTYWIDWANDIAQIAQTHITRINGIISKTESKEREAFEDFLSEIRDDLNESISEEDAVEMLAQHLITRPVFETLFDGYSFADNNPVSRAMEGVLKALSEHNLDREAAKLDKFYRSIKLRVEGIKTAEAKQKIIVELYDKFFQNAFPRLKDKLGIVYTPTEVVDFIIHSVNDVLKEEFGQTLGSRGVHIIDPFTGTGTFITRLLQSGLITPEELAHKYRHEIHANEIVLLAYYIAAINIEQVYHDLSGGEYEPFNGICLTDTFQLYEKDDLVSKVLVDNSHRRMKQKELDIRVIMGNPPYSAGQTSANDNNANVSYPGLDETIQNTYAAHSTATNKNALYDSYIRAIRWGSDQIEKGGIMAYVSNAGWIEGNAADGLRKCLMEEFSNLYVFHLRGNQRTSGEQSRKEGGKIFGSGSRAPIAISLFVKNKDSSEHGKIYFHDIGDYLSQPEKLAIISDFKSVSGITAQNKWTEIVPDKHNDWLNQRDDSFDQFIILGDKKDKSAIQVFEAYSNGIKTNSDAWCYNFSQGKLKKNMGNMISVYNSEVLRFQNEANGKRVEEFVVVDPKKISWHSATLPKVARGIKGHLREEAASESVYRPFQRQWLYYDGMFNQRVALMPQIFPKAGMGNRVIAVSGKGARQFSALMVDRLPCLDMVEKGQCFPLYLYEKQPTDKGDLFAAGEEDYVRRDGITEAGLAHFRDVYPDQMITREDLFYYMYGLLHSENYRARYADNLSKQLPRIPRLAKFEDFQTFSEAGRSLADLHVDYEAVEPANVTIVVEGGTLAGLSDADYRVEKMKFGGKGKEKDKSTILYNHRISVTGIPLEAYDYIINGKSAIDWVMERQGVKTDKASGIVNDANDYALETIGDATYPLKLLQRVITVSLETQKIVANLPPLAIHPLDQEAVG